MKKNVTALPTRDTAGLPGKPQGLSAEATRWWTAIQDEFSITDAGGLLLLQTAMEAFDRLRQAQGAIAAAGPTLIDRFGQVKPHPLLTTERDSRAQLITTLRALNLDMEPLHDRPGRPGGS